MTQADGKVGRAVACGVIGAMAMSGMRRMTVGLGLVEEEPPQQIAHEGVPGLLGRVPPQLREEAIELAHWTYGGVGGAGFRVVPASLRSRVWAGPAYGLVSWLFFEVAVAPVLGLRRTHESRPRERAALAADHVLYGIVVASSSRPHGDR